ncbi:MAG: 3-phosphoserine/phosphohydroxythreonine transaminase [Bacteroidota bacterium]
METLSAPTTKKHNFFAGPAILPATVLEQAAQAALDFDGMGLSILEISHRSPQFASVLEEAESLTRELLGVSDDYAVLFLTGGASSQFYMTAMNVLNSTATACYVDTGSWSTKAIKEAKHFGNVEVLASSKESNFNYIPKDYAVPEDATYLHLTSNNTIYGTQYNWWPDTKVPFVADMSSDIFSRPIDVERFGIIYAGAQKNLGPAGTTLVIVRKDLLGKVDRSIPTMLDYNTHIKKSSAFNTPPVYPIYVCMLTMRWLKANGGVAAMAERNQKKADLIYNEIDSNPLFTGTAAKEDRSKMNVTFVMTKPELEADFLKAAAEAGCVGIKGHRSVGGFRASIYNAMPYESVEVLVNLMKDFAAKQ